MKSKVAHLVDQFSADHKALAEKVVTLVQKYLRQGERPTKAISNALKEIRYFTTLEKLIEQNVIVAAQIGYGSEVIKKADLLGAFAIREKLLDTAIDLAIKDAIIPTINRYESYFDLIDGLRGERNIAGKLPKYIEDILKPTSKNFRGKPLSRIKKAIGNIDRLAQNGAPNKRLKTAYSELVETVRSENALKINKAVEIAMQEKARYKAERVARTEIARAQGLAHDLRASYDDDVLGVKYSLSSRHYIYDICDFHTKADLYGMGPGVYPKEKHPRYPFHQHCLCLPSDVYIDEAKRGQYNPKKASEFISKQSAKDQKLLLGKKGRETFKKTGRWQNNLRNWQGHEKPDFMGIDKSFFK